MNGRRARAAGPWTALVAAISLSCAGPAKAPAPRRVDLASLFGAAFRVDAEGNPGDAIGKYLEVVEAAARAGGDGWQIPALQASLDALVTRTTASFW
jgi:hypothetical protein